MSAPERPPDDDIEAARVRAAVKQRLFGGDPEPVRIGRFELSARLGEGAMGVVYEARDPELDRVVALKLLHPELHEHAHPGSELLLHEARAMARVRHANVVMVHEVGTHGDQIYVAMERLRETLRDWLARVRPGDERRLDVIAAAGRGLAAVHREGLVHRDFKLDNVLVGDDGQPRVSDFGLVQRSGTAHGAVAGTPAYMSPEQLRGEPVDARSDQWSFCVTAVEVLTGSRPFSGQSAAELLEATRRPLPDRALSGIAPSVVAVLRRGLAPEPSERFASMDALLERLQASRETSRASPRLALAIGVVGLAVGGTLLLSAMRSESRTAIVSASPSPPPKASAPAPVRDVTRLCRSGVRASSARDAHPAAHALDGSAATAWTESDPGDGVGAWLEASFLPGTWVSSIEVGGGWSFETSSGVDLWQHNNTFRKMRVSWDGGERIVEFDRARDRGRKKHVEIGANTRSVRITALEVDRGRFSDLCLDELVVFGRCEAQPAP